jgi:transcriptional regulator with XRE-family HTH domain
MTLRLWMLTGGLLALAAAGTLFRMARSRSKFTTDQLSGDWLAHTRAREAFADRVRRQRERRGVSLEEIAKATKIPASLFAALERGDCSRWPAGVYSRAYLRAYAEAIGLDPTEAVDDFSAAFGQTVYPDGQAGAPARRVRAAGALRLTMDDEPEVRRVRAAGRMLFAGLDLAIAFAIAWLVHATLDTGVWITVGAVLAYQFGSRLLSDETPVAWAVGRLRAPQPTLDAVPAEDVTATELAATNS